MGGYWYVDSQPYSAVLDALIAASNSSQIVLTTGTYSDPGFIASLAASKITGTLAKSQQHAQTAYLDATSQVFAGAATFNGLLQINGAAGGASTYLQLLNNSGAIGILGSDASISGGNAADVGLSVYGDNEFCLWTNSTRMVRVTDSGSIFNGATTFNGSVTIKNTHTYMQSGADGWSGGWTARHAFRGTSGADLGGFGVLGTGNALDYYWIGPEYSSPYLYITPTTAIFTKPVLAAADNISVSITGEGGVGMQNGGSGNTGCLQFAKPNGTRQGYIGFDAGNDISFTNEQSGIFSFNKGATFNGIVSSSTEFRLAGNSYSRVAQKDASGGWGGGYNFNLNSDTAQRDSTGSVSAIRFNGTQVELFAESSGSPGAISSRYSFGPTQADFFGDVNTINGSLHAGHGTTYPASTHATYGTSIGFDGNLEHGWIQAVRFNVGEIRALEIQPLGGNVMIGTTADQSTKFHVEGTSSFSGTATFNGTAKLGDYTVATLPSASAYAGHECNVTDSSVTTFGSTVAGGGSSRVKLYSNGTNWTVQAV